MVNRGRRRPHNSYVDTDALLWEEQICVELKKVLVGAKAAKRTSIAEREESHTWEGTLSR